MVRLLQQHRGRRVVGLDGAIGRVEDALFDVETWTVRYLVVDCGRWLRQWQVLLVPHFLTADALALAAPSSVPFGVRLTRKQIENAPMVDRRRPVSRHDEENLARYFGVPPYWHGTLRWGEAERPPHRAPEIPVCPLAPDSRNPAPLCLHRARQIAGYRLEARDGASGIVRDLAVDAATWAIRRIIVRLGRWYAGDTVSVSPADVIRLNSSDATLSVALERAEIGRASGRGGAAAAR